MYLIKPPHRWTCVHYPRLHEGKAMMTSHGVRVGTTTTTTKLYALRPHLEGVGEWAAFRDLRHRAHVQLIVTPIRTENPTLESVPMSRPRDETDFQSRQKFATRNLESEGRKW